MSQIRVDDLTFYYEGSPENIFDHVSFSIDTAWKLGLIGRNGKGKTTFLKLLLGKEEYSGRIGADTVFDYFPYELSEAQEEKCASSFLEEWKPGCEEWKVLRELDRMEAEEEILYRPFRTLSHGERTKVMLAVLFSGDHDFLLIDEPTNHLDQISRECIKAYLARKRSFILVSHDRDLLDACIDHILVLNQESIEVQTGNFSSWEENKKRRDDFARAENEKHLKEIRRLQEASGRTGQWADRNERSKIGYDPRKEPDRPFRAYIGAKTKKMEKRRKQMEARLGREREEKEGLLKDIETPAELKLSGLSHYKKTLLSMRDYGLKYERDHMPDRILFANLNLIISRGERVLLKGNNGCGKTSLIKAVLRRLEREDICEDTAGLRESGTLEIAPGLKVSCVSQDTGFLHGSIREFCRDRGLDESLYCAVLRQLGLERIRLSGQMEDFSQGQKKKALLAASLMTPAHLYIWDEPLNYMDVFSRMQIESVILSCEPTMLIVEHDVRFQEKIATKEVNI